MILQLWQRHAYGIAFPGGLLLESRETWTAAGQFVQLIYQIKRKPDGTVVKRVKNKTRKRKN